MKNSSRRIAPWILVAAMGLTASPLVAEEGESTFILGHVLANKTLGHLELGDRLYKDGDYVGAAQAYYKKTQEDRRNASAWYHLGLAYLKLEQFDYAAQVFQAAVNLDPRVEHQYHLSLALFQGGSVRLALKNLREIVAKNGDQDMAWTLLGRCYECLGQFSHSKSCYVKALEIAPHQGQATFLLERLKPELPMADLGIGNKTKSPVFENVMMSHEEKGLDKLPLSRVIGNTEMANGSRKDPDLISLMDSYNISQDAPEKGLQATEVQEWKSPKMTEPASKVMEPVILDVPKMEIQTEDL